MSVLEHLRVQGVYLMAITARSDDMNHITQQQLSREKLSQYFQKSGLPITYRASANSCSFIPCDHSTRKYFQAVAYEYGVYYSAGKNKGQLLQCFLTRQAAHTAIKAVFFIDDSKININHIVSSMSGMSLDGTAFWYTRLLKKHKYIQNSSLEHEEMTAQWNAIKHVVNGVYKDYSLI